MLSTEGSKLTQEQDLGGSERGSYSPAKRHDLVSFYIVSKKSGDPLETRFLLPESSTQQISGLYQRRSSGQRDPPNVHNPGSLLQDKPLRKAQASSDAKAGA